MLDSSAGPYRPLKVTGMTTDSTIDGLYQSRKAIAIRIAAAIGFAVFILGTFPPQISSWWVILAFPLATLSSLVLLVLYCPKPGVVKTAKGIFNVLTPVAVVGSIIWVFLGLFGNELAFTMAMIHGLLLICLILCGHGAVQVAQSGFQRRSVLFLLPLAMLALFGGWSLLVAGSALVNAERIAAGLPYCIADTGSPGKNYGEIQGLASLRGAYFFTTATGYKSTSRWWLNGVLLVPGRESGNWNWSLRQMNFEPLQRPLSLIIPIGDPCEPQLHFGFRIGLW